MKLASYVKLYAFGAAAVPADYRAKTRRLCKELRSAKSFSLFSSSLLLSTKPEMRACNASASSRLIADVKKRKAYEKRFCHFWRRDGLHVIALVI